MSGTSWIALFGRTVKKPWHERTRIPRADLTHNVIRRCASLEEQLSRRGGAQAVADRGLLVGTPDEVTAQLQTRAELVDELVVSVLPNTPNTWALFSQEVLPNLAR